MNNATTNGLNSFVNLNNNLTNMLFSSSQIKQDNEIIASQSDTSQSEPQQILNSSSASPVSALNISTEVLKLF